MEIEAILEELAKPDVLAAVIDKLGFKTEDDINGLLNNQKKLKQEKLKLKAKLDEFGDIDPEDITKLQERIAELESGGKKPGKADLSFNEKLELGKLKKQVEDLQKDTGAWKSKYINEIKNRKLDEILDENKVDPAFKKVLRSDLSTATQIVEENGEVSLIVNTDKGDVAVSDYAKEYFQSEEGKVFIAKPQNIGGGAASLKGGVKSTESFGEVLDKAAIGNKNAVMEAMNRIDSKQEV